MVISNSATIANRLRIDVKADGEVYDEVIIDDIICIRRKTILADAMTTTNFIPEFITAIENDPFHYEV